MLTSLVSLATGSASTAAEPNQRHLFGVNPVTDRTLGQSYAMALPTYNDLELSADFVSPSDFRVFGSIGRVQMDVWWGTDGSELIAHAVRTQP
jgi:hypothetical protein